LEEAEEMADFLSTLGKVEKGGKKGVAGKRVLGGDKEGKKKIETGVPNSPQGGSKIRTPKATK